MVVVGIGGEMEHGKDVIAGYLRREHGFTVLRMSDALRWEIMGRLRLTLKEVVRSAIYSDYHDATPMLAYSAAGGHTSMKRTVPDDLLWRRELDKDEAWWGRRLRWEVWEHKRPTVRRLLQEYGTEVRRHDDPDYWVKRYAEAATKLERVVTPDVRFLNEAAAVRALGGLVVRVVRPGHVSATKLERVVTPDVRFLNEAAAVRALGGLVVRVVRPGHVSAINNAGAAHVSEDFCRTYTGWDHEFVNDGSVQDLERKVGEWARGTLG